MRWRCFWRRGRLVLIGRRTIFGQVLGMAINLDRCPNLLLLVLLQSDNCAVIERRMLGCFAMGGSGPGVDRIKPGRVAGVSFDRGWGQNGRCDGVMLTIR